MKSESWRKFATCDRGLIRDKRESPAGEESEGLSVLWQAVFYSFPKNSSIADSFSACLDMWLTPYLLSVLLH